MKSDSATKISTAMKLEFLFPLWLFCSLLLNCCPSAVGDILQKRPNVLLIVSDDLTSTALSCYGNVQCQTPNIDRLASQSMRFTRAYCQGTYCGPSRASFLSGYYPHATGVLGYESPRKAIGDRATWPQHFRQHGYHSTRISKIFHMGVPGGIEFQPGVQNIEAYDGADDLASWTQRFNSPGPEWKAQGVGETLEGNPDGRRPVVGGNTFVVVAADGDDEIHSDGKTARKAAELISGFGKNRETPFFLAVGFVRPHVPFVSPQKYHTIKPEDITLPPKIEGDWDDIPKPGINYKTSKNMRMSLEQQKKAVAGYYASVQYMDAQVGIVLDALKSSGLDRETIVIFTSDHGFHLGEHDFWAKVSLHDESARVPLLIHVPGKPAGVSDALVELLDLFPTTAHLAGLPIPGRIQGRDISPILNDPKVSIHETVFSVAPSSRGFMLRDDRWVYIQYGEKAENGIEFFDMQTDPNQYHNLAEKPEYRGQIQLWKEKMAEKLASIRDNDLGRN